MPVILPTDVVIAKEVTRGPSTRRSAPRSSPPRGTSSISASRPATAMEEALAPAKTVFWNGPLGVFEIPSFAHGQGGRPIPRRPGRRGRHGRRRRRRLGGGARAAGPGDEDDPHQHRWRRLARVPRGPRAARDRRAPGPASPTRQGGKKPRAEEGGDRASSLSTNTIIELVDAREILDSRGNPDGRGRRGPRRWVGRACGGAVRRLDRRPRGGRAARRRQEPLRRQGRPERRRQRDRDDRPGGLRARRRRPGGPR